MENDDRVITDSIILPEEEKLISAEDNNESELISDKSEVCDKKLVNNEKTEIISVPFFGGNLSLAEVQEMQRQARKKSKFRSCTEQENNRVSNQLNKSDLIINRASTSENREDCSEYSGKSLKSCKRNRTKSERTNEILDRSCHSANELSTGNFIKEDKFSNRKSVDVFEKARVENREIINVENKIKGLKGMGKELKSYLEQYRKRREKERPNSPGTKSVSSSQFSLDQSFSTFQTDLNERLSEVGSSCLYSSSSEERLERELITDSDVKTESSARSSFVSCRSSVEDGGEQKMSMNQTAKGRGDDCGLKKNLMEGKSTRKRIKKPKQLENGLNRPSKSPIAPIRLPRSLGPDLEAIKPKLTALQKRKEYGNKMSCLNKENNHQKHSSDSNKVMNSPTKEEDGVEVPIVQYTIDQLDIDTSKLLDQPSPQQTQKRKKRINKTKKPQKTADLEDAREVRLMIQRHEQEKRLTENIKHQMLLK